MFRKPAEKTGLEKTIDRLIAKMADMEPWDDDYAKIVDQLDTLYKLKVEDKPDRVSRDTLALVGGNILVTVLIVGYERANVVTSKAISFLRAAR